MFFIGTQCRSHQEQRTTSAQSVPLTQRHEVIESSSYNDKLPIGAI